MRKPIIAGNWKMNKTPEEAKELVSALIPLVKDADCDVVVCVPAADYTVVAETIKGTNIRLGAQNVHFAKSGAYTGELSADMLKACGVEYVVIGHSERRQYFGETDKTVNLRTRAAVEAGLKPIVCVGELKDMEALNKKLMKKGGEVVGVNAYTLDGDKKAIADAKKLLEKKGVSYKNIWFKSDSAAGKLTSGMYSFPTTYVIDSKGKVVGKPIVGSITSGEQKKALNDLIEQAMK